MDNGDDGDDLALWREYAATDINTSDEQPDEDISDVTERDDDPPSHAYFILRGGAA